MNHQDAPTRAEAEAEKRRDECDCYPCNCDVCDCNMDYEELCTC